MLDDDGLDAEAPATPRRYHYQDFFEIRKSARGGLGAFAVRDLKRGDIILAERPLLTSTSGNLVKDYYDQLSSHDKRVFLGLAGGAPPEGSTGEDWRSTAEKVLDISRQNA